jgi:hypothetical protein
MRIIFPLLVILALVQERTATGEALSLSFVILGVIATLELLSEIFNGGRR